MPQKRKTAIINSVPLSVSEKKAIFFSSGDKLSELIPKDPFKLRMFLLLQDIELYLAFNPEHTIESGDIFHKKIRTIVEDAITHYE